jgi:ABC-type transport system involved in multi-copper enzyme maturation permease subunit
VTTVAEPVALPAIDRGRAGLSGQVRSEWTKLRSVRSTWVCLAIVVVAGIGLSALVTNVEAGRWGTLGLADRATFDPVRFSQTGSFLSQFVVGVLGALVVTSEYATGSIRTTLSATSRRTTVLTAKLIVVGLVVLVVAEVTAFASFFTSQAILLAHGAKALPPGSSIVTQVTSPTIPYVSLSDGGALRAVFLSGIYLLLLALLACAIGFLVRHTAGAIATFVGILLVLPLILDVLPSSISGAFEKYLPSNLGLAMTLVTTRKTDFAGVLLPPWPAVGLLVAYAAVAVAVATVLLVRRDA